MDAQVDRSSGSSVIGQVEVAVSAGGPAPPAGADGDGGAAGGAAGVGGEPGIDAGRMEAVGAVRQHSELVSLSEQPQADSALPPLTISSFQGHGHGGQRLDRRLLQPPGWLLCLGGG